jgi:hypothetical protein
VDRQLHFQLGDALPLGHQFRVSVLEMPATSPLSTGRAGF